ncbi:ATP synthase subunit I [Kineobactrum sediminis]|nr:ATP synthase subunit I [Kineobactrum sediminis]
MPAPPVHRIVLAQGLVLMLLCGLAWLAAGKVSALSVLSGSLVAIVPQVWFATKVFRQRGARAAPEIAKSALVGEVGKLVLSAAGFAAVFVLLRPVEAAGVFLGYIAMVAVQIIGSWMLLWQ